MSLSQSLQQKLLQKLSPQQIQLMKLLQVPTAHLEERIKEELEENPALETAEDGHEDNFEDSKDEFETSEDARSRFHSVDQCHTETGQPSHAERMARFRQSLRVD